MTLEEFFTEHKKVALAFSGGVDSAYLLYKAKACGADVKPYFVKSQFQPDFEEEDARRLVSQLGMSFTKIDLDVLKEAAVRENPADRCYYCKQCIFDALIAAAEQDGYPMVMDGTNASDQEEDRPGMRALRERKVVSPLKEAGLTKEQIRDLSKEAGLFTWDKPSYACLATRIPTGTSITEASLKKIEVGETWLWKLGFRDFRLRLFHEGARLEFQPEQMEMAIAKRKEIIEGLKPYFDKVLLDMEGR